MPEQTRVLRLKDMIFGRGGTPRQRLVQLIGAVALRLFFRRIETSRADLAPGEGPLVFVLNHPNGLIDPGLVFLALPRRIAFLAKSTLFRLPVIGAALRAVGTLPLYRRADAGEDVKQNVRTFAACRELLRAGGSIALFPEGVSHNSTRLLPVKTGAARIALGAAAPAPGEAEASPPGPALGLRVVPVGLYYTSKTSFRSEALLRFGPPFDVPSVELDECGEPPREAVVGLTARIEEALLEVTLNADTEEQLDAARKAERLFSSVSEGLNVRVPLAERFVFLRRLAAGLFERLQGGERFEGLRQRVERHEEELRRVGLSPENLSLSHHSAWFVFRYFLLRLGLVLLLSPLALAGAALHLPAYLACALLARLFPRHGPDEITPTVKILAAIIFMPLTWLLLGGLSFYLWGWRAGLAVVPLAALCGYVALRSSEELYDLRGWFKAVMLIARRRRLFLRLLLERRELREELGRLGADD
ncbi:MAG TPA: 1-acyl-sn-glycerol-3-phosphate acyltransferase [Pyrinomonadaceae bacterium]|nr:1-acyl-sn-glycerol-3-phosphate acyltransferase [Pyrinomonadaceae bacterium]